jgi:V/A-type H+-transporting ATPase subunit I
MLIVIPKGHVAEVEVLLGQKDVSRLHLPPELGEGLPAAMLETVHHRLSEIPEEQRQVENALARFSAEWMLSLSGWKLWLQEELEGYQVLSRFGETDATFILVGWVPKKDLEKVMVTLREKIGETVFVQELPIKPEIRSKIPVILTNPPSARPFESLVRMLELPRYNRIDPTLMMSFFLPVFFGLMLADIGYGLIILAVSLALKRKFRKGFLHDILIVIAIGSGWAILFGVLFGEVFGNLGAAFGLQPIWIARDSAEDVFGFLIMSVAIGAGHVSLGLILGLFEAFRDRSRVQMLERGGMLVGLISLFLLVGVLTKTLPDGFMTPAIAGVIVGIVLLSTSLGWLGILMGPIEFIGLIGNVLSYLRIAAIGLASVYLAKVANTMAGIVGNIVVGLILAILIHALNLVLGVFSPTIHSLRLHYVEFFRKFYEGGGKPYEPFRSRHV